MKGRGVSKTLCALSKKKDSLHSLTILIEYLIYFFFAIILIKGHKGNFLCLKKRVWFCWECLLISCVRVSIDPC